MNISGKTLIKKEILKDATKYTAAQYGSQVIGFFTAIAMRRFLGPLNMGIWSMLQIVLDYCSYNSLGVDRATMYKIPFYTGKNDMEKVKQIENTAFGFLFAVSLLTSVAVICVVTITRYRFELPVLVGLYVLGVMVVVQKISAFFSLLLKSRDNFSILSKLMIFDALINVFMVFLLVKKFEIYGLYAMVIISAIANALFIYFIAGYRVKPVLNLEITKKLISFGFPILVTSLLGVMLRSVDRIVIAKMLGVTFVGYYSLGIMARNYVELMASFSTVLRPKMMKEYGKNGKVEDMKNFVLKSSETVAYILPGILSLMFFVVPSMVTWLLPKFVPGICVMQILLLDSFFRAAYLQSQQFLIGIGKQKQVLPVMGGAILFNLVLNIILVKAGYGINGVAVATVLMSMLSFIIIHGYAMKHFESLGNIMRFMVRVLIPIVYMTMVTLSLDRIILVQDPLVCISLKCAGALMAFIPLLIYINDRIGILNIFLSILHDKLGDKNGKT